MIKSLWTRSLRQNVSRETFSNGDHYGLTINQTSRNGIQSYSKGGRMSPQQKKQSHL